MIAVMNRAKLDIPVSRSRPRTHRRRGRPMGAENQPPGAARDRPNPMPHDPGAGPAARTEGERYGELLDFIKESFEREEFEMFLELKGYADVTESLNESTSGKRYFFDAVKALDRRGLIDGAFFEHLAKERPVKAEQIRKLASSWARGGPGPLLDGDHAAVYRAIVRYYPSLRDHAINFGDDLKAADRFVGRDELFRRLEAFEKNRPSGYFRVVADAGLGKTVLAAAAAKRRKAPIFFANASRGLTRPDQCLNHLAVELIARFGLARDHLPDRAGEDSAFLGKILAEAAAVAPGPLRIVVDALDEADPPGPGRNPLLLPDRLPRGVYMLLTHRPGPVSLATAAETADEEYHIIASGASQQADIEAYLRREADRPEIQGARRAANPPISVERFVGFLKGKSEGNFKYLDYVLADIADRQPGFDPLELESLPSGLRGYYQQFWSQIEQVKGQEGWTEWDGLYRPTIAFLAAAREAVPASWLGAMISRPADEIEERALQRWRRFLGQEHQGESERWRVIHQSFVDFLIKERKADLRKTHDRVASFYLSAWGGLETGLPALFDPARREEFDAYGLRHLTEHLERAGRTDDLHYLLRLERRYGGDETGPARVENAWYAAHERMGQTGEYMNDLARAARLVQVADRPDIEPRKVKERIGLGIRYALISSSMSSMVRNILPELITTLVERGVWAPSQGLAYARRIPVLERRIRALIEISPHLDEQARETLSLEVLEMARDMKGELARVAIMVMLGYGKEALESARAISDEVIQVQALELLAPRLSEDLLPSAMDAALAISDEGRRAGALAALAPRLSEDLLPSAMDAALAISDEGRRGAVLVVLVRRLAAFGHVAEATEAMRAMKYVAHRVLGLATLGRVEEALETAKGIEDRRDRAEVLKLLAPDLSASLVRKAMEMARAIENMQDRFKAMTALLSRLASLGHVEEALETAERIGDRELWVPAISALAPHLSEASVLRTIKASQGVKYAPLPVQILTALVKRLVILGNAQQALMEIRRINDEVDQVRVLTTLGRATERIRMTSMIESAFRYDEASSTPSHREPLIEFESDLLNAEVSRLMALGQPERALEVARTIFERANRVRALAISGAIDEALEEARGLSSRRWAGVMATVAPRLAELGRADEAMELVRGLNDGDEEEFRAQALAALAARLTTLPSTQILPLWDKTLRLSATQLRRKLLADLAALAPFIASLGGPEALEETCQAIQDVGRWWP